MLRQINLLSKIYFINCLGINEARFSRDKKKRNRTISMIFVYILLGGMLAFYTSIITSVYVSMGMSRIVPAYLYTVTSIVILFFSFIKSGSIIFNMQSYERTVALPVTPVAIILSRFYTMYMSNLGMSAIVMLPSMLIYGLFLHPAASFYIYTVIGTLFLPLLPITVATAVSVLILAISSKMNHKNVAAIIISAVITLGIVVVSFIPSFSQKQITGSQFSDFSALIMDKIESMYPPVRLYADAVNNGSLVSFTVLISASIALFALLVFIIGKNFVPLCTRLSGSRAKNNYKIGAQQSSSMLKTFYRKELKRYFASNIYVMNTGMGYLLMMVISAVVLFAGPEKTDSMFGLSGMTNKFFPIVLASLAVIAPTTACSISMEGRQWWIAQSLPVSASTVFNSKLLVNLTIALPCYLISEILLLFAFHQSLSDFLATLLLPLVYILFSSVVGISVNLRFPMMNWENETVVIKQSAATLVCMLAGFASIIPPVAATILFSSSAVMRNVAYTVICLVLLITAALLYKHNNKTKLISIEQ